MSRLSGVKDRLRDGVVILEHRLLRHSDASQFGEAQFLHDVHRIVTSRASEELSETIDDPHAVYARHLCAVLGELTVLGGIKNDA